MALDDIRAVTLRILRREPDAPVRVRLLRDVLGVPATDERLIRARADLDTCGHVAELVREQQEDGSWGRLHSRDTKARQRVPTTEYAVERAVALGLDAEHPTLRRASNYLVAVLSGGRQPSDPPEKNDRWPAGVRLFAAATLAQISPQHPALDEPWALWREVLLRTFALGTYDAGAEAEAHRVLHGASVAGSYLILSNRYALSLLAARGEEIQEDVLDALLSWLCQRDAGLGYLGERLDVHPRPSPGAIDRWIQSWEILSRFPLKPRRARDLLDWLDETRDDQGFWDFGARSSSSTALPLSAAWRSKGVRSTDWTTRLLLLKSGVVR